MIADRACPAGRGGRRADRGRGARLSRPRRGGGRRAGPVADQVVEAVAADPQGPGNVVLPRHARVPAPGWPHRRRPGPGRLCAEDQADPHLRHRDRPGRPRPHPPAGDGADVRLPRRAARTRGRAPGSSSTRSRPRTPPPWLPRGRRSSAPTPSSAPRSARCSVPTSAPACSSAASAVTRRRANRTVSSTPVLAVAPCSGGVVDRQHVRSGLTSVRRGGDSSMRCRPGQADLFWPTAQGRRAGADDFWPCERAYHAALGYYLEQGHGLYALGDLEEPVEVRPRGS